MLRALLAILVAAVVGLLALLQASARLPDLDMRTQPWTNHGGTFADLPPGQGFRCSRDGLHRIDVAVPPLYDAAPDVLELELRAEGPDGELLRRARGSGFEPAEPAALGGWIAFEFEPLHDSAGRGLHLTLRPAEGAPSTWVGPWIRFRGIPEQQSAWGPQVLESALVEGEFLSQQRDLRGLGFSFQGVQGTVVLVLAQAGSEEVLRRVEREVRVEQGWVLLAFPAIEESRWKEFRFALHLPDGSRLHAIGDEPALVSFHGSGSVDPRLGGMTLGDQPLPDQDLVLRAWSSSGPAVALELLRERMGWRLWPVVIVWLAASGLLALALPGSRARRDQEPTRPSSAA